MKGNRVNPPLQLKLPQSIASNTDLKKAFDDLTRVVDQLWRRTGAGDDYIQNEKLQQLFSFAIDKSGKAEEITTINNKSTVENVFIQQTPIKQNNVQLTVSKTVDYTEKLVITDVNFTTTESMTVICDNNATDININLNATPDDNEIVFVKKIGSKNVSVNSAKTIDGLTTQLINVLNESLMIRYIGKLDKWLIT